jgi:hypothetical protein
MKFQSCCFVLEMYLNISIIVLVGAPWFLPLLFSELYPLLPTAASATLPNQRSLSNTLPTIRSNTPSPLYTLLTVVQSTRAHYSGLLPSKWQTTPPPNSTPTAISSWYLPPSLLHFPTIHSSVPFNTNPKPGPTPPPTPPRTRPPKLQNLSRLDRTSKRLHPPQPQRDRLKGPLQPQPRSNPLIPRHHDRSHAGSETQTRDAAGGRTADPYTLAEEDTAS